MKKILLTIAAAVMAVACKNAPELPELSAFTFDAEEFAAQYEINKAEWDAAFEFLSRTDLDTLTAGPWHQLTERTRARVQETTTREEGKYEAHRHVIDVFYVLDGIDKVAVCGLDQLRECTREYSEEKDVELFQYAENPRYVVLERGQGVMLFPSDGHCPNLCTDGQAPLKLVVVKVPYGPAE